MPRNVTNNIPIESSNPGRVVVCLQECTIQQHSCVTRFEIGFTNHLGAFEMLISHAQLHGPFLAMKCYRHCSHWKWFHKSSKCIHVVAERAIAVIYAFRVEIQLNNSAKCLERLWYLMIFSCAIAYLRISCIAMKY